MSRRWEVPSSGSPPLADETKTYPVYVSAVDKWGGETSATVINVQPGRSFINVIKDNLEINPICGGLAVTWENPMGADAKADDITQNSVAKIVYVVVDYIDSEGVKRTRYLSSKQKMAKANIRNMFAGNYVVSYRVEDASGNKTAQSTPANVDVLEPVMINRTDNWDNPRNSSGRLCQG